MSGSKSSLHTADAAPAAAATPIPPEGPVTLAVHDLPLPPVQSRKGSRWTLWLVILVCASPVIASYFSFYVLQVRGKPYSDLIEPTRDLPTGLTLRTLDGRSVAAESLKGQWLLTYVPDQACAVDCERMLFMQRQLREMLGKDRDRVDKLVLVPDDVQLTPAQIDALTAHGAPATVLSAPRAAIQGWLTPADGHRAGDHLYLIDPMGRWMMRTPANAEPAKLRADLTRLMRANVGWDRAGR